MVCGKGESMACEEGEKMDRIEYEKGHNRDGCWFGRADRESGDLSEPVHWEGRANDCECGRFGRREGVRRIV